LQDEGWSNRAGGGYSDDFQGGGGGGGFRGGEAAPDGKNDCEIVCVSKMQRQYAEMIEARCRFYASVSVSAENLSGEFLSRQIRTVFRRKLPREATVIIYCHRNLVFLMALKKPFKVTFM
jgi:hypothetical protein